MNKRLISIFLLITLSAGVVSCDRGNNVKDTDTPIGDGAVDAPDAEDIYVDLPNDDYTGMEFTFANEVEASSWCILTLDCDEPTGEVLDNAIYQRNRSIEEKLGVTIDVQEYSRASELPAAIRQNAMSGDDPIDVYDVLTDSSAALIQEGYFMTVDDIGIDIEKPWWNKTVMDSLTVGGECYSIAGDLSIMLWEASYGIVFNKDIAARLGLEDHYDLVRDGKWTLDVMYENMVAAWESNGDLTVDDDDTFGMCGTNRFMPYMMIAGGENIVSADESGFPEFNGLGERLVDMYSKILGVYYTFDGVCIEGRTVFKDTSKTFHTVFTSGDSLYYFEPIGCNVVLRDVKFDYGYLPMPKYDEAQEDYITPILQYAHTMCVTKSKSAEEVEMISAVLENLAAYSHKNIRSVYFDTVLEGKRTRDDGTIEMFDIIFSNQVFSPVCVYNWGKLSSVLTNNAMNKKEEIVSSVEAITPAIKADIEKTVEFYTQ